MLKTHDILIELAKLKKNNDFDGFKELFDSLDILELAELNVFARELKNSCEIMLKKYIK